VLDHRLMFRILGDIVCGLWGSISKELAHAGTVLMAPAAADCLQSLGGQWPRCYLLGKARWGFLM
jgi:hypothetical protein